MTVNKL